MPIPFEGETVFSYFARVVMRVGCKSPASLISRLGIRSRASLPSPFGIGIGGLFHLFPQLTRITTPEEMVWRHTTAPLLIAFSPKHASADQCEAYIAGVVERGAWASCPRTGAKLKPIGLRDCPECMLDDVKVVGIAYWHREHQVAPVSRCWRHGCLLREHRSSPGVGFALELPGCGRYRAEAPVVNLPAVIPPGLAWQLAKAFADLLDMRQAPSIEEVRVALIPAADESELLYRGRPSRRNVYDLMIRSYGASFLGALGYPTHYSSHVASRYLRPLQATGRSVDPVLTVLVASALTTGLKWKELGQVPEAPNSDAKVSDVATAPPADETLERALKVSGYCLNRAMTRLGISRHQLIRRIILGNIECPIVQGSNAKFDEGEIRRMIRQLRRGRTREWVQKTYGCNSSFIDQLAIYDRSLRDEMKQLRQKLTKQANRTAVLNFIAASSDVSRSEVWNSLPGPVSFLSQNDKTWLTKELRKLAERPRSAPGPRAGRGRIDDAQLDSEIVSKLQTVIPTMRELVPPRRLTPTLAIRLAGLPMVPTFAKAKAGRLPKTSVLFGEIRESTRAYVARKLEYAFVKMAQTRRTVTMISVRQASGLPESRLKEYRDVVQALALQLGMPFGERTSAKLTAPMAAIQGRPDPCPRLV